MLSGVCGRLLVTKGYSRYLSITSLIFECYSFQRPTAKELLKYPFIRKAKKNSYLIDLIDRYKKWKSQRSEESETESENSDS